MQIELQLLHALNYSCRSFEVSVTHKGANFLLCFLPLAITEESCLRIFLIEIF